MLTLLSQPFARFFVRLKNRQTMLGSAFLYTLSNGFTAGLPLLLMPILTRLLTPEDYGLMALFAIVITAFGAITGLNTHGAVTMRYFDRSTIDFPAYVGTAMGILVMSTLALCLLVQLFATPLVVLTNLPPLWLFVAIFAAAFHFILQTQLSIFQSAKKPLSFAYLKAVQASIDVSLTLGLILLAGLAWQGRAIGQSGAMLILGAVSLYILYSRGWLKFEFRADYAKKALAFGIPIIPHVLGGMLIAMADRFMIANILDVASTGIYMIAVQIAMALALFADACHRASSPYIIEILKKKDVSLDKKIVRFGYLFAAGFLCIAVALGLAAPWFLPYLVGKDFVNAGSLVLYLLLGQVFGGLYLLFSNIIFYANRTAILSVITLTSGVLNIVLSYWLLPVFGLYGAAYAYISAQCLLFIGTFILAQTIRPLPWLYPFTDQSGKVL